MSIDFQSSTDLAIRSEFSEDEDFAELIEMFLESARERKAELLTSFQTGDWDRMQTLSHQLKGAGGGYGFPGLTPIAASVESACKEKDLVKLAETMPILTNYLDRLSL